MRPACKSTRGALFKGGSEAAASLASAKSHHWLQEQTQLTTTDVMEALDICLQSSFFTYNYKIYKFLASP